MNPLPRAGSWAATSLRGRLGLALVLGLAPVLIVSAIQSSLAVNRESRERQAELAAAAQRSAAIARARIASAEILLQTLGPGSIGYQCAPRLAEIKSRIPGYDNLIRFDSIGRVACAAADVPADPSRRNRPWFTRLAAGQAIVVTSQGGVAYAQRPAILASVRSIDAQGRFDGVLTAVIDVASLRPQTVDRALPDQSQVAITDSVGRLLSTTSATAFPTDIGARLGGRARDGPHMWFEADRLHAGRVFTSAPLVGQEVYVVLSAPLPGVLNWAVINPISAIVLPMLAFLLPLLAVGFVAERGVVRWIVYLRRISALYARGRYGVHPRQAEQAAPEIRQLAESMDSMARTIAARDKALRHALAEKDDLLREIHHRVKNNLQVISSLLNIQERALVDASARAAMSDTRQRIGALALIYRSLYQGTDLRRVDLHDFLEELVAQALLGDTARGAIIRTHLKIDPIDVNADQLAPLALFAVEAIANARKHGLEGRGGMLSIALKAKDERVELSICDSGAPGAPPATMGEGMGKTLMCAFARQLRGEVGFSANPRGGLTAKLNFPTSALGGG